MNKEAISGIEASIGLVENQKLSREITRRNPSLSEEVLTTPWTIRLVILDFLKRNVIGRSFAREEDLKLVLRQYPDFARRYVKESTINRFPSLELDTLTGEIYCQDLLEPYGKTFTVARFPIKMKN